MRPNRIRLAFTSSSVALILLTCLLTLLPSAMAMAQGRGGSHGGGGGSRHGGGSHGGSHHGGGSYRGGPHISWGWGWGGWGWGWGPGWGTTVIYTRPNVDTRRLAVVDTDTSPETAEVYLNGKFIGLADDFDGYPDYLYLRPGSYELEFRHPAYEPLKISLKAQRGQKYDFSQDMKLLPSRSKLDHFDPPDRGTPLGRVFGPDVAGSGEGEPEETWSGNTQPLVEEKPRTEVLAELPARARILWKVSPEDAAVYLDDRYTGEGQELSGSRGTIVKPGKHTVTVMRPGYVSKTVEVETKPGETSRVFVELEKGNEPR